jgi:hypothetical protein
MNERSSDLVSRHDAWRLALALAFMAFALACQPKTPRAVIDDPGLRPGIEACAEAKASVRDRLEAQHSSCAEDADCVGVVQEWLGCRGWQNLRTPLPWQAKSALVSACTGVPSLGLHCDGNVGACVQGRCMGRERLGANCTEATAALVSRAATPVACTQDDDCAVHWIDAAWQPVSARFQVESARELHAFDDACDWKARKDPWKEDRDPGVARCVESTCRLLRSKELAVARERPRQRYRGCFADRVAELLAGSTFRGTTTLKFLIGPDGRAGAFRFVGLVPKGLHDPLIWAALKCTWEPATREGKPVGSWVVIPIKVK